MVERGIISGAAVLQPKLTHTLSNRHTHTHTHPHTHTFYLFLLLSHTHTKSVSHSFSFFLLSHTLMVLRYLSLFLARTPTHTHTQMHYQYFKKVVKDRKKALFGMHADKRESGRECFKCAKRLSERVRKAEPKNRQNFSSVKAARGDKIKATVK